MIELMFARTRQMCKIDRRKSGVLRSRLNRIYTGRYFRQGEQRTGGVESDQLCRREAQHRRAGGSRIDIDIEGNAKGRGVIGEGIWADQATQGENVFSGHLATSS